MMAHYSGNNNYSGNNRANQRCFSSANEDTSSQGRRRAAVYVHELRVFVDGIFVEAEALIDNDNPAEHGVLILDRKRINTIYGEVRMAQRALVHPTNRSVTWIADERKAIKIFVKEKIETLKIQEDHERELEIQSYLCEDGPHPNIMPVQSILKDSKRLYVVMPYAEGGELFEWVANGQGFVPEVVARELFRGMVEAVQYIHEKGVCHRDVSLENFVLKDRDSVVPMLIDFGLAYKLEMDERSGKWQEIAFVQAFGKPNYISPEFFLIAQLHRSKQRKYTYDGIAQDLWALAVCLWMILFRQRPWKVPYRNGDPNYDRIVDQGDLKGWLESKGLELTKNADGELVYAKGGVEISEILVDLLQNMFRQEPHERYSTYQILSHPWMLQVS